jgi:integrase
LRLKTPIFLGVLADDWLNLDCPMSNLEPRTPAAADALAQVLARALDFWREIRADRVTPAMMEKFAEHRRATARPGFSGARSADIQLAALSSLCRWAVKTSRLASNPFSNRETFQRSKDIRHCHEVCPESTDQWSLVLTHLYGSKPDDQAAARALHFASLTGLRSGEVDLIQAVPEVPRNILRADLPGTIYSTPDGARRMKITRTKRGQNPQVKIHPALAEFLQLGTRNAERGTPLFPASHLGSRLARACAACGLPRFTPHGFGRAYYVKVRRAQGAADETIAQELGQRSAGDLIRNIYGNPADGIGGESVSWNYFDKPLETVLTIQKHCETVAL